VSAYINEKEHFNSMLEVNLDWQKGEITLLYLAGKLEEWISGKGAVNPEPTKMPTNELTEKAPTMARGSQPKVGGGTTDPRTLMITPAVTSMVTGECRQLSAIAIYSNGSAQDASAQANWRAASASGAIVSTTGLVTALRTGSVTISADLSNLSESRPIKIATDSSSPFKP
jgi:hypothetical protein